jgi:hypothetical protein
LSVGSTDGLNKTVASLTQWLRVSSTSLSMIKSSSINSITVGMFALSMSAQDQEPGGASRKARG